MLAVFRTCGSGTLVHRWIENCSLLYSGHGRHSDSSGALVGCGIIQKLLRVPFKHFPPARCCITSGMPRQLHSFVASRRGTSAP